MERILLQLKKKVAQGCHALFILHPIYDSNVAETLFLFNSSSFPPHIYS